ncbi:calcium/sodium antiporter [Anianabacter salinae]|uniref:calcium/sodium antiporter n=1 Tax=Anianabacter salinae TaxID=2851023 RepID=UPI00225DF264|nr:calcium/sodium antiporter [Anianabacter salinae]MBV0910892.1 calcium/sodium antiporter [Anianabacter salinae]
MDYLYVAIGLVLLILAGDALVKGAVNLALRLGIPALIVSLTIVAFGTSAPEMLISVDAVLKGVPGLALGNVIGSNTANILLVLGLPALLTGLQTKGCETRKSYSFMMAGTAWFVVLAFLGGFTWVHALLLLAALALILGDQFIDARRHRRAGLAAVDIEDVEGAAPDMAWWKVIGYLVAGLIGLPVGADLLVEGSTSIAQSYGISDEVIGLTLVAVGTSLPELATTLAAAYRRQADVALGNVIGSNMFNLLAIIGVAALVGPLPVSDRMLGFDIWVMVAASALLAPFVFRMSDITRVWGFVLTALYVGYVWLIL